MIGRCDKSAGEGGGAGVAGGGQRGGGTWLRMSLSASGLLSPITLRKATFLYCSLNSSNLGAMILHGPHHEVE